jgi:uncharacterized protein (TIGR04255 family)
MALPRTISPCPILEALFEIRFTSKVHPSAVFGMVYNVLQKEFPKVDVLPILQLAEVLKSKDPRLKFKPHYRISNQNFVIQIGPDVLTISSLPKKYMGWEPFSNQIFDTLKNVDRIGVIGEVSRIGIRYINFFENDIFKNINLKVSIGNDDIECRNTIIRTEIEHETFKSSLQVANNANQKGKLGSIIDIDTFTDAGLNDFFVKKEELIKLGHSKEKELFFSLLKEDFLKTLNPTY